MVDIGNDFYEEIIDDPRHKLPDGVQRAKYGPKSAILDTAFQNISEVPIKRIFRESTRAIMSLIFGQVSLLIATIRNVVLKLSKKLKI